MKRIISIFLCVAMLMSMVVTSVGAWEEDTASSISTENIVSYSLNQTTYAPGDEVLITVNMDEIWGDPDLVGTVPGYSFEAAGAYGMALFAPSLVFPTDVFNVTKTIRDYAGSSTIYGLGKDPNGDRWGNVISKTDVDTANESGFLCCLIESKDIYTYEYEDEDTGDYVEKKVFGFFQGSGVICQFRLNVSNSAVPGTYKLPIGAFQRASDANDSEWEFFGNYFKSNVFVDSSANAYGERPLSFVSATDEYVNDDPSQGAYVTIVIEGEESDVTAAEVDALIAAIGSVTIDSEDAITAARTAYNALSVDEKSAVKNLAKLEDAEVTFNRIKTAASITNENIVSYSLDQETYKAGDEVLITVKMDEIWGDPDLVGTIPGFSFEGPGAYGMAMLTPSIAFPTDVFNVTKTIRDYAGSSKIYGLGKDPNGDKWGNIISKTDTNDANTYGFLCALVESKDIYTYEYLDEETGEYVEKKIFGLFQGSGNVVQFRMNINADATHGTYKIPLGSFQRANGASDSEWEFFGNYFKANGFVDGAANAYGERPLSFVSATDEYVNDDPSQGAYITIVIEGEENSAATEVDALIAAIGTVTLDSEDAITAARTAYNALNATNKAAVKNLATLVAAEKALETLKLEAEAAEVDAKISAIGTVTLSSEGAITAARIAYNALSSGAKAYVKNLAVLEAAEKTLAELKDSESTEEDLKAAAGAVDAKIYAIGSVTIDSEDAITAARAAYDALDVRAKAYVKNLAKLEDAEVTFDRIKTAASITNENIVSYSLNQETYKAGDEVLITVKMDEIWGDPDLVGTIPGFSFEGPGAYGMAMLTPSIAFPTDVFNVTKTIRDYAGSSTIYGLGKDPNGDKWGNIISKTDTNDANTYGFLCALVESKDIYTYEYLDEETGEYVEKKIFGLFQGSGNVVQFRMNINADATPGTYKIPLGSFQRANGASDSEWEFFGNYFKANGFVDGAANAYGERPLSFVSATDEYVNDDPSQGAYITIVIEGEEIDVDNGVDALIVAIGKVTLDSEDAISAAREAYDALSDADKAAVKYLETLIAAEDKLIQLKKAFDTKHIHNVIDGVIAPVVPQNIKATTTDSTITVTWDAVDGAHKYWILVDGVVVAATSGNSCTIKRSEGEYDIAVRVALRARYGTSYVAGTSDAIKAKVEEVFKGYAFDIKYSADTKFTASWSYADAHIEKAWMLVTAESGTVYTFRVDNSTSLSYAKPYMFGDDYKVAMRVLVDGKIYHYDA